MIYAKINKLKDNINAQIEDLDTKLDKVLEKNERDFLTAYRFHMLKVQNELLTLKKKANETELKGMQDSKLAELEKEVHTVQNECMEIRKYCDDIEKKVKSLNYDKQVLV